MELSWNNIIGLNKELDYVGNIQNGVILPDLKEEVLFCRNGFIDHTKDIYFSGYIIEEDNGLVIINSVTKGTSDLSDEIQWARFNRARTNNSIGYAIAYLDEYGRGFKGDIPNIICIEKTDIGQQKKLLNEAGYSRITVFTYVKPYSNNYNWDYVETNKVSL